MLLEQLLMSMSCACPGQVSSKSKPNVTILRYTWSIVALGWFSLPEGGVPHDTYAMTTTSVHTYVTELLQLCHQLGSKC